MINSQSTIKYQHTKSNKSARLVTRFIALFVFLCTSFITQAQFEVHGPLLIKPKEVGRFWVTLNGQSLPASCMVDWAWNDFSQPFGSTGEENYYDAYWMEDSDVDTYVAEYEVTVGSNCGIAVYKFLVGNSWFENTKTSITNPYLNYIQLHPAIAENPDILNIRWQSSCDKINWQDIAGANDIAYDFRGSGSCDIMYYRCTFDYHSDRIVTDAVEVINNIAGENRNYIKENTLLTPWQSTNSKDVRNLPSGQRMQTATYLDGLGRVLQQVNMDGSLTADGKQSDMCAFYTYDELGRQDKNYLPFPYYNYGYDKGKYKENISKLQRTVIGKQFGEGEYIGYSQTVYDNTPLSRVTKTMRPGASYVGSNRGATYDYDFNTAAEGIKIWRIGAEPGALPYTVGQYGESQLIKNTTTDEEQHTVIRYSDKSGRLILTKVQKADENASGGEQYRAGNNTTDNDKWLCNYYVYDDMGAHRYTITPKAVQTLVNTHGQSGNWTVSTDISSELCFYSIYDDRGRVVVQHTPGAGETETIYDSKSRPVYVRNETDKQKGQWLTMLYDELDRPVLTGYIQSTQSRETLAAYVAQQTSLQPATITTITGGVPANLTVDMREPGKPEYTAGNEIVFEDGFESESNAEFIAQIDNTVPATGGTLTVMGNPLPPGVNLVTLSISYYDDYSYSGAKPFSNNYSFPANSNPYIQPTIPTQHTLGMMTGKSARVIDGENGDNSAQFLTTTVYYDNEGRSIQTLTDNYLKGTDVYTARYDWAGFMLNSCFVQDVPGTAISNFTIGTAYEYDLLGRLTSISKSYGGSPYKKLLQYSYDEYGNIANKVLSPDYKGGQGLETLDYSYNILGQLTGINKTYSRDKQDNAQWDRYFGMELVYDNREGQLSKGIYNGALAGQLWKSRGNNKPNSYEYDYYYSGEISKAQFGQRDKPSQPARNNTNYSLQSVSYDHNGNISRLQQMGMKPGEKTSSLIDDLTYSYDKNGISNRLTAVTDAIASPSRGAGAGKDFTNGQNLPAQHYAYDPSGNLLNDYNKGITPRGDKAGILYNILGKPCKVTLSRGEGRGEVAVKYVYDAGGTLLARAVTNEETKATRWEYHINGLVLHDKQPQYFANETGRLRISQVTGFTNDPAPALSIVSPDGLTIAGKPAFYDFYITDHQGSTRMVLTEEEHAEYHLATMETGNDNQKNYEESMFGQSGGGNELVATRADIPVAWSSHYNDGNNQQASRLIENNPVGPNVLLKVMAGDELNLKTDYFYNEQPSNNNPNVANNIVNALLSAVGGNPSAIGAGVKDMAAGLQSGWLSGGDLLNYINTPNQDYNYNPQPKAYLNWLFFDENFNPIPYDPATGTGSNAMRVTASGDGQMLVRNGIKAPQNGYVFVYLSNSSNTPVWFDNMAVVHTRGRILQEHSYYPYGMEIAALSSKAYGKLDNGWRYQGAFSEWEEETGWDNFDLRCYDPQLGRWTSIDPYGQYESGYLAMGNYPVFGFDIDGGWAGDPPYDPYFTTRIHDLTEVATVKGIIPKANWGKVIAKDASYIKGKLPPKPYKNTTVIKPATTGSNPPWHVKMYRYYNAQGKDYIKYSMNDPSYSFMRWAFGLANDATYIGSSIARGNRNATDIGYQKRKSDVDKLNTFINVFGTGISFMLSAEMSAENQAMRRTTNAAKGSGRVFWSGGGNPAVETTAREFATNNGMTTLEMTRAGENLTNLTRGMSWVEKAPMWRRMSTQFAKGANGTVHVFQNAGGISSQSVWGTVEYPILKQNGVNIIYHLVP